jgi:predicted peroxiredoxin
MAAPEKLLIMITHGADEAEQVTMPMVMAVGALASEVDVVVGLQEAGVELAVKGAADAITATGYPALSKLMADYRDLGGRLLACPLGVAKRGIDRDALVENAEVVAAGRFILEMSSATHVLVY